MEEKVRIAERALAFAVAAVMDLSSASIKNRALDGYLVYSSCYLNVLAVEYLWSGYSTGDKEFDSLLHAHFQGGHLLPVEKQGKPSEGGGSGGNEHGDQISGLIAEIRLDFLSQETQTEHPFGRKFRQHHLFEGVLVAGGNGFNQLLGGAIDRPHQRCLD